MPFSFCPTRNCFFDLQYLNLILPGSFRVSQQQLEPQGKLSFNVREICSGTCSSGLVLILKNHTRNETRKKGIARFALCLKHSHGDELFKLCALTYILLDILETMEGGRHAQPYIPCA